MQLNRPEKRLYSEDLSKFDRSILEGTEILSPSNAMQTLQAEFPWIKRNGRCNVKPFPAKPSNPYSRTDTPPIPSYYRLNSSEIRTIFHPFCIQCRMQKQKSSQPHVGISTSIVMQLQSV